MKQISLYIASLLMASAGLTGCSLDEVNKSSLDSGSYFTGETQYEQLVNEAYLTMRPLLRVNAPVWYGTDIYTCQGDPAQNDARNPVNDYSVMGGDEFLDFWTRCYDMISKANSALTRGEAIPDISEDIKVRRTAELKALRAYTYFTLVENFGGVPLILQESANASYNFPRETEEKVYTQIISDLEGIINDLPDQPEAFGRVSKGFAYHLLAKVYLTRSYKEFGDKTKDLRQTITYADKALALHPYLTDKAWETLFGNYSDLNSPVDPNQQSPEVIFSVRYSADQTLNGSYGTEGATWGNNLYQYFKPELEKLPGGSINEGPYWRCQYEYQPTMYYFSLFDDTDLRGSETYLQRHIKAAADDPDNQNIGKGDEIIYCPATAMTDAEKADYKQEHPSVQWVVNPDQYHNYLEGKVYNAFPIVWKFFDSRVNEYANDRRDPKGTRDTYVFRSAETLLLKAEALVQQKNGSSQDATGIINTLRQRASASIMLTQAATIDDVLDESARELFGEANRWMDLKRTGKLLERAWKHNPWVKKQHASADDISTIYQLRPIPITEIANSNYTMEQNEGFPGAK